MRRTIKKGEDYISKYATDESNKTVMKSQKAPKIRRSRPASSVMSRSSCRSSTVSRRPKTASGQKKTNQQDRLKTDKNYLKKLSEGLPTNGPEDAIGKMVSKKAGQTVDFLNNRNQFWKQVQVK